MARVSKLLRIVGCLLIVCSLGALIGSKWLANRAAEDSQRVLSQMEEILPQASQGITDSFTDMQMPALQVEGCDYVAILEVPAYGVKLPVAAAWEAKEIYSHPCRFSGTVYDGSLVIGGADQQGQMEFLDRIYTDSAVTVRDMTGAAFDYVVADVRRSETAEADKLMEEGWDLTLFVRDSYTLDYIIVRCISA